MKEYKYYIFDMDLTLLNTFDAAIMSYKRAFKVLGKEFDESTVAHHLSISLKETFDEINGDPTLYEEYFNAFINDSLINTAKYSKIYDDGITLINRLLKEGKVLGIVTNRDGRVVKEVLDNAGIYNLFSSIITNEKVKNLKPSPEPLEKCMEELGAKKEEVVYIGDAKNDYMSTINAGIDFIAIERYNNCQFGCPTIVHSLTDIK